MDRGYVDNKKVQQLNYEWKVNNFEELFNKKSDYEDNYGAVLSDEFSSGISPNKKTWQLNLYFNNYENPENNKWVSLLLKQTAPVVHKMIKFIVDGTFYILDKKNERVMIKDLRKVFMVGFQNGYWEFIEKKKLWDLKDELLVLVYDTDSNLHGLPSKIETSLIANDIKELYRTKKGSDIVIKFEEREFKAHKVLLHARSSVFSAMLTQDNISSQISEISIPRVKADIFSKLLEFIYTDQVIHLDEFAQNLLEVAERYQVKALKHICEVSLSQFLSAENALRTLTVAKLGNSQKLADYVIKFININPAEVFQSNEYKQWEKEKLNPGLIIFQNSTDFYQRKNAQKRP
ncbi:hypothetical protein KQX54_002168 [Cotesia glomerata]|uniref:BTB domain-containing protein n=1 Tax=Cotesia glomerata TaxID=32391 RepID=A0AAV7I2V1_COTGL|nr:hypothetical protein KQX54_002168 [Cotesia glomerata]